MNILKKQFLLFFIASFCINLSLVGMNKSIEKFRKKSNLHQVSDTLFRSGSNKFKNKEYLTEIIKELGIKKIYAFTHRNEDSIKQACEENKVNWQFLTIESSEITNIDDFLILVRIASKTFNKTIVYDRDGRNRTGFFSALHLLLTSKKAEQEKALEQFSWYQFGYKTKYHRWFSDGGINFMEKFGECYLKLLKININHDDDDEGLYRAEIIDDDSHENSHEGQR